MVAKGTNRQDTVYNVLLKGGVSKDVSINDINRELVANKERVLQPSEIDFLTSQGLASNAGFLPQLGVNIKDNTLDLLRGLKTSGAIATQYSLEGLRKLRDKITGRDSGDYPIFDTVNSMVGPAIGNEVSNYVQDLKANPATAGVKGTARITNNLLINPILGDFGTSTNDLISTYKDNPSELATRILPNAVWSIYDKPVTTSLDLAPVSKAIPEGAIAKAVHKLPIDKEIKYLFETPEMKEVNTILSDNKLGASTKLAKEMDELGRLRGEASLGKFSPADIVESLRTGEWKGNTSATRKMRDISKKFSQYAYELGVPAREMDDVVRANNYMSLFNPDVNSGFLQDVINKFESGANVSKELKQLGTTPQMFEQWLQSADKAIDEGRIAHISQILAGNRAGDGIASNVEKRLNPFLSKQSLGNATNEKLGEVLFDTYDFLGNRIQDAFSLRDSLNEITNKFGRIYDKTKPLKDNEVLISPSAIKQTLMENYSNPNVKLNSILKPLDSSNIENLSKKYNDLVAIDQSHLDQLARQQTRMVPDFLDSLNTSFKGSVLSTLKFFTDNRYGNAILNTLEGVTPKDYIDAIVTRKDMPSKLLNQTSYAGFLGKDFVGNRFLETQSRALGKVLDKTSTPSEKFKNFNMLFSNLIIPIESKAEGIDRYANMIRQAKRINKDWKSVISEAKNNKELYRKLNTGVNDSLGDYVGRNFAINPKAYEALNLLYNFYKYPAQSARVVAKQSKDRPLPFQLMVMNPSRAGNEVSDKNIESVNNRLGDSYSGGTLYRLPNRTWEPYEVLSYQSNPVTAPLDVMYKVMSGKPDEAINVSPVLGMWNNILRYQNNFGNTPTSPSYRVSGDTMLERSNVNPMVLTGYHEPTLSDKLKYGVTSLAKSYITPVVQANNTVLPLASYLMDETFYPAYDTTLIGQIGLGDRIPYLVQGNTMKRGREGFEELIGNLFGLRAEKIFEKNGVASPSLLKSKMKRGSYEMKGR